VEAKGKSGALVGWVLCSFLGKLLGPEVVQFRPSTEYPPAVVARTRRCFHAFDERDSCEGMVPPAPHQLDARCGLVTVAQGLAWVSALCGVFGRAVRRRAEGSLGVPAVPGQGACLKCCSVDKGLGVLLLLYVWFMWCGSWYVCVWQPAELLAAVYSRTAQPLFEYLGPVAADKCGRALSVAVVASSRLLRTCFPEWVQWACKYSSPEGVCVCALAALS
jgi:hypothetical protein